LAFFSLQVCGSTAWLIDMLKSSDRDNRDTRSRAAGASGSGHRGEPSWTVKETVANRYEGRADQDTTGAPSTQGGVGGGGRYWDPARDDSPH
jgi:hypothetical protein